MGTAGSNPRWLLVAVALAATTAAGSARAEPDAGGRRWRVSSVTVGFADDFLGLPRTRLNDDNGFVACMRLVTELSAGGRDSLRLVASEQMITQRGGPDRVDEGRLAATWLRAPESARGQGLTLGLTTGVEVVGNLGGGVLQDWAHRSLFTGRVLDATGARQLQDRYPRRTDVLGIVGGLARLVHPLFGGWSVRGGMEATAGAGDGLFGELHPYVAVGFATEHAELELRQGAGAYGTTIRPLLMAGGYVTRLLESETSARLTLRGPAWFPAILSLAVESNRGGSRQHVGEIAIGARF